MIRPEIDAEELRKAVKVLRTIDKTIVQDLSKGLKTEIKPVGEMVAREVNDRGAPLSGFNYPARTMWQPVKSKVSVTPGRSRSKGGMKTVAAIDITSGGGKGKGVEAPGYAIVEIAGHKSQGHTPQGRKMINVLNQRSPGWPNGGRFAYKAFRAHAHDVYVVAKRVINDWVNETNKKLENL